LDLLAKKELLDDINLRGGVLAVDIKQLIEDKPDCYGNCEAYPKHAKAVDNLIRDWRRRPAGLTTLKNQLAQFSPPPRSTPNSSACVTTRATPPAKPSPAIK
jgi:hypothetical protein